jgi:hypothetical protein
MSTNHYLTNLITRLWAIGLVLIPLTGMMALSTAGPVKPASGSPFNLSEPEPHVLSAGDYVLLGWDPAAPAGTYPAAMRFWTHALTDPTLDDLFVEDWSCGYDLANRSRIQGHGAQGFSFINTTSAQFVGVCDGSDPNQTMGETLLNGRAGAAVLALNTTGVDDINVEWTGRTIAQNSRVYGLRFQYRVGNGGGDPNTDWLDLDTPVEYLSNATGHAEAFKTPLPASCSDQPLVQVRWVYYYISGTGARAQIGLDDIFIRPFGGPGEYVITNPDPHTLALGDYAFTAWDPASPAGTWPDHMRFWTHAMADPGLDTDFIEDWSCGYDLTSRSRFQGLGADGLAFANEAQSQFAGVCDGSDPNQNSGETIDNGRAGAAVLALNTTGMEAVAVGWTGRTVQSGGRIFALRLQYRVGDGASDPNAGWTNTTTEYVGQSAGHSQAFSYTLPTECEDRPLVQVRWVYYQLSGTGTWTHLALDEVSVTGSAIVNPFTITDPAPFNLEAQDYSLLAWSADSPRGTFPGNMRIWTHASTDPTLETNFIEDWTCGYNLPNRSRVLGEGDLGFSFINTGNSQFAGVCDGSDPNQNSGSTIDNGRLGAAVLALRTPGNEPVRVYWTGRTIAQNSRVYGLRLQYRIGNGNGNPNIGWEDLDTPVEYVSGETGHSQAFSTDLPAECRDQELVQVRWVYYYISGAGARAHIALDDIIATRNTTAVGQPGMEADAFRIWPNPALGGVEVVLAVGWEGRPLHAYNAMGQLVREWTARERMSLDLGGLSPGMYILRCGEATRKLILQQGF